MKLSNLSLIYCGVIVCFSMVFVSACDSKEERFKQDAEAFCKIHNPENWRKYAGAEASDLLEKELNQKINSTVKTEEFKKIVSELNQVKFMKVLYGTAKEKISKLTKENWQCEYYKQFYSLTFERQSSFPDDNHSDPTTIVLGIDASGNYTLDSMELMDNNLGTLRQGIETITINSPPKIIVKAHKKAPKNSIDLATKMLYELGVRNSTIIYTD